MNITLPGWNSAIQRTRFRALRSRGVYGEPALSAAATGNLNVLRGERETCALNSRGGFLSRGEESGTMWYFVHDDNTAEAAANAFEMAIIEDFEECSGVSR